MDQTKSLRRFSISPNSINEKRVILMAVDLSVSGVRSFDWYAYNLMRKTDTVYIFHVPDTLKLSIVGIKEGAMPTHDWESKGKDRVFKIEEFEKDYEYRLQANRLLTSQVLVSPVQATSKEQIAELICQETQARSADMIILAGKHHGGLRRRLFSGVVQNVLERASKPVLVCPPIKCDRRNSDT